MDRLVLLLREPNKSSLELNGVILVTDKPNSPHLLAPKIKARLYFAIAADDDKREPDVKNKLRGAFTAAKVRAELKSIPMRYTVGA